MRKGKIYILYYDFPHTKGNHAGMAHLAKYLDSQEEQVKLVRHIPQEIKGGRFLGPIYAFLISVYLFFRLRKEDRIVCLEYLTYGIGFQDRIANWLRFCGFRNRIVAFVHLGGEHLLELYGSPQAILSRLTPIHELIVFGSTLRDFLINLGYKGPVHLVHHYVDTAYYKPLARGAINSDKPMQVIVMGAIKRNFDRLEKIVLASPPNMVFHCCLGKSHTTRSWNNLPNVHVYGFLDEPALLYVMQQSDVHLSVMDDTIGSNAVTSCLATGLVQVISDVGSIGDYCTSGIDSILCQTDDEYVKALKDLDVNRQKLERMKQMARAKAQTMSLQKVGDDIREILR